MRDFIIRGFATGLGGGYSPIFPGAVGVLEGVIIAYWIYPLPFLIKCLITLILIVIAIPISTKAEALFQEKDPHKIIIDEIGGVMLATIWFRNPGFVSIGSFSLPLLFIWALLLFGLFDALKPFPANVSQKLPGGWGVVIDDVIAGLYTALAVYLIIVIH